MHKMVKITKKNLYPSRIFFYKFPKKLSIIWIFNFASKKLFEIIFFFIFLKFSIFVFQKYKIFILIYLLFL